MKAEILLSAVVLAAGCSHGRAVGAASAPQPSSPDEVALAEAVKGRVAGPAQECVPESTLGSTTSYGRAIVVFTSKTGDVVWVNRPVTACPEVTSERAVLDVTRQASFCRGDVVTVFDPVTRVSAGTCTLGDFTPYRRAP